MTDEQFAKIKKVFADFNARMSFAKEHYHHKVTFGFKLIQKETQQEMMKWCEETCSGGWDGFTLTVTLFFFENKSDALQFKLRWGGDGSNN